MSWNYRVVHQVYIAENGEQEDSFGIHECYYREDGTPYAISVQPDGITADSVQGLRDEINHILDALGKPVLEYTDF